MKISDLVPDVNEDDDEATVARKVAEAINKLLGGSTGEYAMKEIGPGMYSMVFGEAPENDARKNFEEAWPEELTIMGAEPSENLHPLNIFDETESKGIH